MRSILITLAVAGAMFAGYKMWPTIEPQIVPLVKNAKFPTIAVKSKDEAEPRQIASDGQVKGIMTKANELTGSLFQVGSTVGNTAVKVVSEAPTSEEEVIDVSKVVAQITTEMEKIPSKVVDQAKVEYCKKVIEEAQKRE